MRIQGGLLLLLLLILTGCGASGVDSEEPAATLESDEPTPVATPTLMTIPQSTLISGLFSPTTLNVWIANQFSQVNDPEGGPILADQFSSFQTIHPEISVEVEGKVPTGPGGILSYLQAGSGLASEILPDLVMLPSEEVEYAVSQGLIFPLDAMIDQEMVDDLFPAARIISQVDGATIAYPFAFTDMRHLVFDSESIDEPFPDTWNDLLDIEDAQFAFPARGMDGAEMALQLYLAAGGSLIDEANQPILEVDPLTQALSQINRGATRRVIERQSANLSTDGEAWELLIDGDANIIQSRASTYLANRLSEAEIEPARVPGFDSALRPFVNGWVWAISTPEPARQLLAMELLSSIASGPNIGEWSISAGQLPARRSAYSRWPLNSSLTEFYLQASEHAHQFPEDATDEIMNALNDAVLQMIVLSQSPRSAAEEAAQAVGR